MEFKICGIHCIFSFSFFAFLGIYMLLDKESLGLLVLFAIIIHECGHLLALYFCGGYLERVEFAAYGIRMEKRGFFSYGGEGIVYIAGISANAIMLLICLILGQWEDFAKINLALLIFNSLPIGRLDGGVLFKLMLCRIGLENQSEWISMGIAIFLLLPLYYAAISMVIKGNYTLFFTATYLFYAQFFAKDAI